MQKGAACSENARKYFGDSDQRAGVDSDTVGFVKNKMVGHFLALIAIVSLVETWLVLEAAEYAWTVLFPSPASRLGLLSQLDILNNWS